jgi:hypothetical protein
VEQPAPVGTEGWLIRRTTAESPSYRSENPPVDHQRRTVMHRRHAVLQILTLLVLVGIAAPSSLAAQAADETKPRFGIGFQSAWPSYGISGQYDVTDRVTAQAIVGAFGTVSNFGARGLYRFDQQDKYDLYGFATAGLWSYDYTVATENVVGFGGGGGVELDWRRILSPDDNSFPPLFSSIDIGFVLANFDYYDFSSFSIGGGIHYRF